MVCYRTDDQVRIYNKRCDCSKRVQRQNRNRIKQVKIWLLRKSYILLNVESIFLLVDFVSLQGIQVIEKTCSEKPIVIFWISCNKFICLNWSVVLVKEKLKTQQLLRKQSLKRNGYSWRKKAERREEPRKRFRENESILITGQCIHGYFILYKHRALLLFGVNYLPISARYMIVPRAAQSRSQSLRRHANEGSGIIHRRKQKNRVPIEKSMRQEQTERIVSGT